MGLAGDESTAGLWAAPAQQGSAHLDQVTRGLSPLLTGGFQNRVPDGAAAGSVYSSVF